MPKNSPSDLVTTTFAYNPSGSIYSIKDGKDQTTTFEYDASDLKTKMIYPNGDYQQWTYDPAKNLIARRTANGAAQLFSYDSRNRQFAMAWSNGADWGRFSYDDASRMIGAQNATSTITRAYDDAGRPTLDRQRLRIVPITAVSRKSHGTAGTFDIALPLVGTAGVECRSGGPNNDHQLVVTFPRPITSGPIELTSGTASIASTSTSADRTQVTINLTAVTNAQTVTVTMRAVGDGIVANDVNISMGVLLGDVDGSGRVDSNDMFLVRNQSLLAADSSTFRSDVDLSGRIDSNDVTYLQSNSQTGITLVQVTQPLPSSPDVDVQYGYDPDGRENRLYVSSAGYDRTYTYDAIGRFEKIFNTGAAQLFQYSYDAASNETHRMNNVTGVDQNYGTPDSLNRMMQRDVNLGANTISHEAYSYEPNRPGLLSAVDRGPTTALKRDAFAYDLTGELTSAQYDLVSSGGSWITPQRQCGYVWDKAGNRSSMTDTAGPGGNYGTTNLNQYWTDGVNPIGNGSEHELSSYQNISYAYINDTHLSSVSGNGHTYQLNYDALGRCVVRVLDGSTTYYIYDGEKPIVEYGSAYSLKAANTYGKGIDEILMRTDYTTTPIQTFYYQDDHEGSITHLTGASGQVIESYRYDAFGKPTIFNSTSQPVNASTVGNRFMFTGREYASQFGIYEYRNRAYHPGLGRFMSEDPKGFGAGDNNFFRYCGNDPLDRADPMGLTDIAGYTSELESLIVQASINSRNAYFAAGDRQGRSQYIIQNANKQGPVFLQTNRDGSPKTNVRTIVREEREAFKKFHTGEKFTYKEIEKGDAGKGFRAAAAGHFHGDETGQATRDWSEVDRNTAGGKRDSSGQVHPGKPLGLMTESDQKHVKILVPQEEGGSREKTVDVSGSSASKTDASTTEPARSGMPAVGFIGVELGPPRPSPIQ